MEEMNKNSLSYKIQKNPFLLGLFVIVIAVVLIAIFSLSSAISEKTKEFETTTEKTTVATTATPVLETEKNVSLDGLKKRVDTIKNVSADFDNNSAIIVVEFEDKEALLDAHYASNDFTIDVVPVFCFYINNGTQVTCPGEFKFRSDGKSAEYKLAQIDDLANVVALTDEITVNYKNVFEVLKFNLYLEHQSNDGVGRTLVGTYPKTVESFNKDYAEAPAIVSNLNEGVEKVQVTTADEFIWVDVYFTDEESYKTLNHDFENNFVCFGFEKGGKKFDWKFISTEYEDLCMIRCKLDAYALTQLADEIGDKSITIPTLFKDYQINIWTSDYDTETPLFTMN
ncbi:MAG: hypothetical protein E7529_07030 [Ruminococcaceae bacterium]|nr:hypothetical protein [Oscillospiraceae bacterium]